MRNDLSNSILHFTKISVKGGPRSIENCTYDSENFGTRETDNVISETSENVIIHCNIT